MNETAAILSRALEVPVQALGLDLDGTIDENPHFFSILSRLWPGKVYFITYRIDREKAVADLADLGIRYDDLVLVDSFAEKAKVIKRLRIQIYIEDMDEVIAHVAEDVTVLKVRNGGNFAEGKWLYAKHTGRQI